MNIGEKLRSVRKSRNMTIYRLSLETGISQNHISGVEQGKRQPTVETLIRLTKPLGITLAELFNDDGTSAYLTDDEKILVENYRCLSQEKAEALLNLSHLLK